MTQITFSLVQNDTQIRQILDLQALNHVSSVSAEVAAREGFVTVRHDFDTLKKMNDAAPSAVALLDGRVLGYCIAMLPQFSNLVPVLAPLFERLKTLSWKNKPIYHYKWMAMGQVCVAQEVRGRGVFDGMYRCLADAYSDDFQLLITDISTRNTRSLRAHLRVGFQVFHTFHDNLTGEDWDIVVWEWRSRRRL